MLGLDTTLKTGQNCKRDRQAVNRSCLLLASFFLAVFYIIPGFAGTPCNRCYVPHASVGFVPIAGSIKIFPPYFEDYRVLGGSKVNDLLGGEWLRRKYQKVVFVRGKNGFLCTHRSRYDEITNIKLTSPSESHSRGFTEIGVMDSYHHAIQRSWLIVNIRPPIGRISDPHIWTLVFNKIVPPILYGDVSQNSLPSSKRSVQEDQSSRDSRPKKLLFLLGSILGLAGLVLVFKVLDKVYLDPRFNVNMAVGGFFVAAGLFCLGIWILLYVFSPTFS